MQILVPDSWLREYLETDATPKQIQTALSLCGPSIERLHQQGKEFIYDIEVTTNRVDCMSVIGIAFECAAILPRFGYKAVIKNDPYQHKTKLNTSKKVDYLEVDVNPTLCQRFSAVLIKDVSVTTSPDWLVKKLEAVGLRSLNNVVDISNYLMWEMGQPVHTYDYDKIHSAHMVVRESRKGEKLTTLDHKTFSLLGHDIVITDGSKELIDLCGIMGGLNSAVDSHTKNVLLFVQVYEPNHIRKTSMSLAQRTNAAVLFEKKLPVENVLPTMEKGIAMFITLTGGKAETQVLDILSTKEGNGLIHLKTPLTEFVNNRLGINLSFLEITKILKSLEFEVHSETKVEVPWARKDDVQIPEDLVEEVARVYGYHNLPTQLMAGEIPLNRRDDKEFTWITKIKNALKYWGLTESYTYSLVASDTGLKISNPLSNEWSYLRTNLASSHRQLLAENAGKAQELKFFEIANVYIPVKGKLPREELHLVLSTNNRDRALLKGLVTALFNHEMGVTVGFNDHKEVFEFPEGLFFEIELSSKIASANSVKKFSPLSKFAPIIEDVNVTYSGNYQEDVDRIKKVSPLIQTIELVDRFENKLTLRLTFLDPSRQLSKSDIAPIREKLATI